MRVVVDTNIIISGIFWEGNESSILKMCKTNEHTNIISPPIIEELERVISSKKFKLTEKQVNDVIELVLSFSILVFPAVRIDAILSDITDNRILECAVSGNADVIISGDKHLLGLKEYKGIKTINAKAFLETKK